MKKTIGEQVAQFMADQGISSAEMARRSKTSRQNIEGLIKRKRFPRGYIDTLSAAMGVSIDTLIAGKYEGKGTPVSVNHPQDGAEKNSQVGDTLAPSQTIPTYMPYESANLHSAILLMGSLLGALDDMSRDTIGHMLTYLAKNPDNAPEIAAKASALATVQKPITRSRALDKAIQGRGGREVETQPAPLDKI